MMTRRDESRDERAAEDERRRRTEKRLAEAADIQQEAQRRGGVPRDSENLTLR